MAQSAGASNITTGQNHAGVKKFRGYAIRGSVAGVVRFRDTVVGGQILWIADLIVGTAGVFFPEYIHVPGGVYVELVSGTFTEGVLLNGG